MRLAVVVPLVMLVACRGEGRVTADASVDVDADTTDAAPPPPEFVFGWSPPCQVPVVESIEKDGQRLTVRYAIDVTPAADGLLEVRLRGYRILKANGHDVTSGEAQEELRRATAMMAAMPVLLVSRTGEFKGTRDLEGVLDAFLAEAGWPAEEAAQLKAAMLTPAMEARLEGKMSDYWNTWVGAWIGWPIFAGERSEADEAVPLPEGGTVTLRHAREYLDHRDGYAMLRDTTTYDGAAVRAAMAPLLAQLRAEGAPADLIRDARKVVTLEAETHFRTLRPRRTRWAARTEMTFAGGERKVEDEVRELRWDWSGAVGCGR